MDLDLTLPFKPASMKFPSKSPHRIAICIARIAAWLGFLSLPAGLFAQSVSATYGTSDIPTSQSSWDPTCNGASSALSLPLPAGGPWVVTGLDVEYNMTAQNGGFKSHQRSYVYCANTDTGEPSPAAGVGDSGGVQSYSRTGLTIANGAFPGGTNVVVQMRAWRSGGPGSGCNTTYNRVDNFTWTVTIHYVSAPPQGSVGIGTTTPDSSAALHVDGLQKGFLPPRMGTAFRLAITNPAEGLIVYDTDLENLFIHTDGVWRNLVTGGQWEVSGSNVFRPSGNVGIGDNNPATSLSIGTGGKFRVSGTEGNLTFTDDLASIRFPTTTAPNSPMLYMFSSGTQNADRMIFGHSPNFPLWGIEYRDTADVLSLRTASVRSFNFELNSGHLGIGIENPAFPIDLKGRMRLQHQSSSVRPGIWFQNQAGTFDRALIGMAEPDSILGIYSQHLGKWAIEFEVMREPRIGINIPNGSPPRSELHLYHTNFGGSNDGVRIQNEGPNLEYWNLYTSNSTGDFEFYSIGIKRATIDDVSGAYTAVSDARFKKDIAPLEKVLDGVMQLQPKTYRFTDRDSDRQYTGLIAQELEQVFPQFVHYGGDDQKTYSVDYGGMSVIALKAIQEQQVRIESLEAEIETLKEMIRSLAKE